MQCGIDGTGSNQLCQWRQCFVNAHSFRDAMSLMVAALEAADLTRARAAVRLTLTAGSGGRGLERPQSLAPRLLAVAAAAPAVVTPARLVVSSVRRNEGSPSARLKTLSYLDNVLARREALARGGDEAVMLNNQGQVACAAAANLFWISDGTLFTPALTCGVLDGIMRRRVMAQSAVAEVAVGLEALEGAQAIFLTNSLIGVREVESLDGRPLARLSLVAEIAQRAGR